MEPSHEVRYKEPCVKIHLPPQYEVHDPSSPAFPPAPGIDDPHHIESRANYWDFVSIIVPIIYIESSELHDDPLFTLKVSTGVGEKWREPSWIKEAEFHVEDRYAKFDKKVGYLEVKINRELLHEHLDPRIDSYRFYCEIKANLQLKKWSKKRNKEVIVEIEESDYSEIMLYYDYYGDNLHDRCLTVEKHTFGTLYEYAPGYKDYIEELEKKMWNEYLEVIISRFDID